MCQQNLQWNQELQQFQNHLISLYHVSRIYSTFSNLDEESFFHANNEEQVPSTQANRESNLLGNSCLFNSLSYCAYPHPHNESSRYSKTTLYPCSCPYTLQYSNVVVSTIISPRFQCSLCPSNSCLESLSSYSHTICPLACDAPNTPTQKHQNLSTSQSHTPPSYLIY